MEQTFPGFRRRDASRRAREEPNSKPLFEFSDGMAQRRLGEAQLRGGFVKLRSRAMTTKA